MSFQEYTQKVFIPYLEDYLKICERIDVVFDQYFEDSLKNAVREKRGSGIRFKVEPKVKVPKKWHDILLVNENKVELFLFLAKEIEKHPFPEEKEVNVTMKSEVLSINSNFKQTCSHEEADSRMLIHVMHALEEGNRTFMIQTVDTDVIVILLGKFNDVFSRYPDFDVWIKFGVGKSMQHIHLKTVVNKIGLRISRGLPLRISRGLPFFHALTGCDTTSSFKGKGKKSAWQTWKSFQAATPIFEELSQNPFYILGEDNPSFQILEKFIVRMYSKNVDTASVDEARKLIFAHNQNMEKIPPTRDALLQHIRRAIYQTGNFNILKFRTGF